jgi:uncharacterized delta-60 repeat protein
MFDRPGHTTPNTSLSGRRALAQWARMLLVGAMIVSLFPLVRPDKAQAGSDCQLDPTFNRDGTQTTDFFAFEDVADMVIQPDGKILVVGNTFHGGIIIIGQEYFPRFALARYNSNGSLDKSFGNRGRVVTDFHHLWATAIALQTDGKILVTGNTANEGADTVHDFALARYNPDGHLDPTFGDRGGIITDFSGGWDAATSVLTQTDGKIVVAGYSSHSHDLSDDDFALARYNSDGSLDRTFDGDGKLVTAFDNNLNTRISDIALQPDGKIVAVGSSTRNPSPDAPPQDFALARYNPDGQLDTTFDGDGRIIRSIAKQDVASAVALQPDGKIVVAGSTIIGDFRSHAVLVRYNPNGSPDAMFDDDGVALTDLFNASDMALQPDGKIILVGDGGRSTGDFVVARYQPDGSLDTSFGSGGKIFTDFLCGLDFARAVALQPDGKIVVSGKTLCGATGSDFALARYPADPTSAQPRLLSVKIQSSVPGCQSLSGAVTLCAPAPPGGLKVKLADNMEAAFLPSSVTVEAGETTSAFDITTTPVTSTQVGNVVATLDGVTRSATLTVRPFAVASIFFYPNPVEGPGFVQGTMYLECSAPRGGLVVQLSSLNPGVAAPVQSRVRFARDSYYATFTVRTADVTAPRSAIITATVNGITKRSVLRVN